MITYGRLRPPGGVTFPRLAFLVSGYVALYFAIAAFASGCAIVEHFPYAACLYDSRGYYERGEVIAKRDSDDAKLFQFADPQKGDNGFYWVKPDDARKIRICREATLMDAARREMPLLREKE